MSTHNHCQSLVKNQATQGITTVVYSSLIHIWIKIHPCCVAILIQWYNGFTLQANIFTGREFWLGPSMSAFLENIAAINKNYYQCIRELKWWTVRRQYVRFSQDNTSSLEYKVVSSAYTPAGAGDVYTPAPAGTSHGCEEEGAPSYHTLQLLPTIKCQYWNDNQQHSFPSQDRCPADLSNHPLKKKKEKRKIIKKNSEEVITTVVSHRPVLYIFVEINDLDSWF